MKKQLLSPSILLLFALSVLSVNMLWVSAAEYPAIMVVPESTETTDLTVGMLYTVSIYTDYTGKDIVAYQFTLSYNPSVLNGFEVTNGKLIVGIAQFIPGKFDNTAGKLSLTGATFLMPGMPGGVASGPGTLANVTFTVVGYGTSNITLGPQTQLGGYSDEGYGDPYPIIDAYEMPEQIQDGFFSNKIPGDIDGDRDVDRYDLGSFAMAYGSKIGQPKYNLQADLDRDGDVDRYDLGTFAMNYGRHI